MGVDAPAAAYLGFLRRRGVVFHRTLTLGHQSRTAPSAQLADALAPFGVLDDRDALLTDLDRSAPFAVPVFEHLGASTVDALDASAFEGATILADLNAPLPDHLGPTWSLVYDGGTTEHVFDFPRAIRNAMSLVAPDGHLVTTVPTNQQVGHGFYQVSPELYFRLLSPENGFEVRSVHLHVAGLRERWYRVPDPATAGHRITFGTGGAATTFVCAQRTGTVGPDLAAVPMQSDYEAAWETGTVKTTASVGRGARLRQRVHHLAGPRVGASLQAARQLRRSLRVEGLERTDLVAEASAAGQLPTS